MTTINNIEPIQRTLAAIILGTLAAIAPLCTDLYLPAFPIVSHSLNATASQVQLSLTASLLGIAVGQLFIGPCSDIIGRRKPLLLSLLLFMLSSFLCAVSTSILELIILRFIQGLAGSGGIVLSRAIACDMYQGNELTKFFSLLMMINGIAPIASPVMGGQILKFTNWQGIFFFLGICGVLMLLAVFFKMPESLPKEKRSNGSLLSSFNAFGKLLKNDNFMCYVLIHSLVISGLFGYIAASPFVLQQIYGLSAESFSLCFAINGLGIMLFAQITGRISIRFNDMKILGWGLTISLIASLLILLTALLKITEVWLMIIPLFFMVSCVGITTTTSFSLAIATQANNAGSAAGIIGVSSFILGALASPLVGIGGGDSAIPMGIVLVSTNVIASYLYKKNKLVNN